MKSPSSIRLFSPKLLDIEKIDMLSFCFGGFCAERSEIERIFIMEQGGGE